MHVITYSPNFAPPHFAAGGIPKNTPHGTMEDHTAYIYILSLYPFRMEFFFFFLLHKTHTFTRPDSFCNVWKSWGDAVPMGKLLFLPVCLRDVNVPISWRTEFGLKVTCLFPCAVEGGWFVRSYKMKEFTRHTFPHDDEIHKLSLLLDRSVYFPYWYKQTTVVLLHRSACLAWECSSTTLPRLISKLQPAKQPLLSSRF